MALSSLKLTTLIVTIVTALFVPFILIGMLTSNAMKWTASSLVVWSGISLVLFGFFSNWNLLTTALAIVAGCLIWITGMIMSLVNPNPKP